MMKFKTSFILLFCISSLSLAQEIKYEREFRIRSSDFPENARALLLPYLEDARRLKFYKELDGKNERYEAKYKREGYYFSVEFDNDGKLLDTEIAIRKKEIPEATRDRIESHLDENFRRYRLRKIQRRFPATDMTPEDALEEAAEIEHREDVKYELVISGKKDKGYREYELIFDADGSFVKEKIFAPSSYEHVLY